MTPKFVLSAAILAAAPIVLSAQSPPSAPPLANVNSEAAGLMQGWALMAQGQPGLAESHAKNVLKIAPRSVAGVALAIESGMAAHGAQAGLDYYDQFVGQRTLEEPSLLRRVALGFLKVEGHQEASPARSDALRTLASEPGAGGAAAVADSIPEGPAGVRLRASLGDDQAVRTLIDELSRGTSNETATIDALARSRARPAVAALAAQLKSPRPEVRAAAAEGLGQLGLQDAVPALRASRADQSPFVQMKAAAALLKLNDTSGLPMLREMLADPSPAARLAGAQALADSPDATWLEVVRDLAKGGEPTIRLAAAKLILSHDPELARSVADSLATDTNLAVRELATRAQADLGGRDLARLRPLLRSSDALTRVKAASAILAATR
jgi:HEAT repeat protein